MIDALLILLGLWCFASVCFTFGWIMGAAAAMGKHADELAKHHEAMRWVRGGSARSARL